MGNDRNSGEAFLGDDLRVDGLTVVIEELHQHVIKKPISILHFAKGTSVTAPTALLETSLPVVWLIESPKSPNRQIHSGRKVAIRLLLFLEVVDLLPVPPGPQNEVLESTSSAHP